MTVHRYAQSEIVVSNQDPFEDVRNWLAFLCAKDFTNDILTNAHGLSSADAKIRTKMIIPYVRVASRYLEQGIQGPAEISFLSFYYAILNLLKIYILIGPHFATLPANRWHGATYNGMEKDSHSIATEIITIKRGGVIPLFYRTITGKLITSSEIQIKIRNILPFVSGVTHEYELATKQSARIFAGNFYQEDVGGKSLHSLRLAGNHSAAVPLRSLTSLKGFSTAKSPLANVFYGPSTAAVPDIRSAINCRLLYRMDPEFSYMPGCRKRLELFEELPIALLFFYLSNICRYKPDFLERLGDSRYWPLLMSCRTHSLHSFLLCFWSFVNQKNIFIKGP